MRVYVIGWRLEDGYPHEMRGQMDMPELPCRQAIMNDEIPQSIGGGIGPSRTHMLLLPEAHPGEVSVAVWPQTLTEISAKMNLHTLE